MMKWPNLQLCGSWTWPSWLGLWMGLVWCGSGLAATEPEVPGALHPATHIWSGGALTETQLKQAAATGIDVVIDLRPVAEMAFDSRAAVTGLGLRYEHLPIAGEDDITPDNAARLKTILDRQKGDIYLHCASGNRVGALAALMARAEGQSVDAAVELGKRWGLGGLEDHVRDVAAGMSAIKK